MAAKPVTVDYKNDELDFQMVFPAGLKPGQTSIPIKYNADEFFDHVGVLTPDHFNPTAVTVTTGPIKGNVGVAGFHDTPGDWIRTANRVPIKGADGLDSAYIHANIPGSTHSNTVRIRPTKDQFKARVAANNRKAIPLWSGMTAANIRAGVHESKLGDKTRWIVTRGEVVDGQVVTRGAMHAYISRNTKNRDFMDGSYFGDRAHTTEWEGEKGYVVKDPEHIKLMDKMIGDMVETHSPFAQGFGAVITNNGKETITDPVTVHFKFARTPITKEGFQAHEDDVITEHDARRLVNGGVDDGIFSEETGAVIVIPGWEDVLERSADPESLLADHEIKPYATAEETPEA